MEQSDQFATRVGGSNVAAIRESIQELTRMVSGTDTSKSGTARIDVQVASFRRWIVGSAVVFVIGAAALEASLKLWTM